MPSHSTTSSSYTTADSTFSSPPNPVHQSQSQAHTQAHPSAHFPVLSPTIDPYIHHLHTHITTLSASLACTQFELAKASAANQFLLDRITAQQTSSTQWTHPDPALHGSERNSNANVKVDSPNTLALILSRQKQRRLRARLLKVVAQQSALRNDYARLEAVLVGLPSSMEEIARRFATVPVPSAAHRASLANSEDEAKLVEHDLLEFEHDELFMDRQPMSTGNDVSSQSDIPDVKRCVPKILPFHLSLLLPQPVRLFTTMEEVLNVQEVPKVNEQQPPNPNPQQQQNLSATKLGSVQLTTGETTDSSNKNDTMLSSQYHVEISTAAASESRFKGRLSVRRQDPDVSDQLIGLQPLNDHDHDYDDIKQSTLVHEHPSNAADLPPLQPTVTHGDSSVTVLTAADAVPPNPSPPPPSSAPPIPAASTLPLQPHQNISPRPPTGPRSLLAPKPIETRPRSPPPASTSQPRRRQFTYHDFDRDLAGAPPHHHHHRHYSRQRPSAVLNTRRVVDYSDLELDYGDAETAAPKHGTCVRQARAGENGAVGRAVEVADVGRNERSSSERSEDGEIIE